MALRNTSTLLLSISVLMASTGLAQAGFIWLAPEQSTANSSTYSRQAEPPVAEGTQLQGRQWPVDSAVPVVGTQPQTNTDTAAMVPAPLAPAEAQTLVSPPGVAPVVESSVPAPAPMMQAEVTQAQIPTQAAPVLLKNETVSATPIVSPGDQPISAPVVAPAPAVEAPAAMATFTPTPPAQTDVTLAAVRSDSAVVQQPAAPGMPTAETLINSMPSMTSPTPAPTPVETAAAPAMLTPAAVAPAPAASLATAEPLVSPPGVAAPVAAPAPVASGNAVSLVTGESVMTQAAAAPGPTAKVVDGFGKQVPLVIAMRQILPSDYGFAHRDGVDLGQLIDWQGGRPWPQVLSEALAPVGVKVTISGDTVLLEKGAVTTAAATQTPVQEAPRARLTDTTIVQTH